VNGDDAAGPVELVTEPAGLLIVRSFDAGGGTIRVLNIVRGGCLEHLSLPLGIFVSTNLRRTPFVAYQGYP
jgi:hypothetical protein